MVEDEAVVKDQIPLNKKKKIVAKVKPQEAVPDEKDHIRDDSGQEDDDDFLDDIMPMTNKCNLDIVFKELEKDPKFHDVRKWLKGIEDDASCPLLSQWCRLMYLDLFPLKLWESLERVANYLNLFPLKVWEIFEWVRGYLDLFGLKVWEMLEWVASYLNLFPLKLWDVLERVPSYLDLVPHSD